MGKNKETKKTDAFRFKEMILNLESKLFDFFTLSQLGKSLISIQDMEDLSRVFASSVYEASNAINVALIIYDPQEKAYTYHYSIGLDESNVNKIKFLQQEGLLWQVLHGGQPFLIRDSAGRYRFRQIIKKFELDLLDSEVWVPLIVKNYLRGILTLGKKKDGSEYSEHELNFISQLAVQAAIAIDSAIFACVKSSPVHALNRWRAASGLSRSCSKFRSIPLGIVNNFRAATTCRERAASASLCETAMTR